MAFASITELDEVTLDAKGQPWTREAQGRTIWGGPFNRPVQRVGNQSCYVSIKAPYYEAPLGWGGGSSTITCTESDGVSDFPGGTVYVREIFYRASTEERSTWGKTWTFSGLTAGKLLSFASNAPVPDTEDLVTHREFYVSYVSSGGPYYFWQRVPYTTNNADDTLPAGFSAAALAQRRPLEDGGETGLFPAVYSAQYAFGRLWGCGMASRKPLGCTVTLTNGSAVAVMSGGQTWSESDHYRAIVYAGDGEKIGGRAFKKGEVLAYVKQVLSPTMALLSFPQGLDQTTYPYPTTVLTNSADGSSVKFYLSGRGKSDLYCTPIYAGEAYGGLSNGAFSWTALNTVRDPNRQDAGGRALELKLAGDSLVVFYERGVSILESRFAVENPPQFRFYPISQEVGTFNARAAWADSDRNIYIQASGRIWQVAGSRLVDVSRQMGVVAFHRKMLRGSTGSPQDQRVIWDAEGNRVLFVGLTKAGDPAEKRYGLLLCFDQPVPTLHPLRFGFKVNCGVAVPREKDGIQFNQIFLGGENGRVHLFGTPGVWTDTYYDEADVLQNGVAVSYFLETGAVLFDWKAVLHRMGFLFENDAADFAVTAALKVHDTNNLKTVARVLSKEYKRGELSREWPGHYRDTARAVRVRLSGTNAGEDTGLYRVTLLVEPQKATV